MSKENYTRREGVRKEMQERIRARRDIEGRKE